MLSRGLLCSPRIRGVWLKAQRKLGVDSQNLWKRVKGPITSVIATLRDLGWKSPEPDRWLDEAGSEWQIRGGVSLPSPSM